MLAAVVGAIAGVLAVAGHVAEAFARNHPTPRRLVGPVVLLVAGLVLGAWAGGYVIAAIAPHAVEAAAVGLAAGVAVDRLWGARVWRAVRRATR